MATDESQQSGIEPVDVFDFEGTEVWQESDPHARLHGYFPLSPGTPNAGDVAAEDLMVVSMEIDPDDYLPTHRDSNEELLLVLGGRVEAWVDDETVELEVGECLVVPEMAPHGLRNVGDEPARVVGFFPDDDLTATFEEPLEPFGTNVVAIGDEADE